MITPYGDMYVLWPGDAAAKLKCVKSTRSIAQILGGAFAELDATV